MQIHEWMFRIPIIQKRYLASGSILTECITLAAIGEQEVYVYHGEDFDFNAIDPANITSHRTHFLTSADSLTNALGIFYTETKSSWAAENELNKAVTLDAQRPVIQLPICSYLVTSLVTSGAYPLLVCQKNKYCDEEGNLEYFGCYLFCRNLSAQTWCRIAEFMEKIRRDKKRGKIRCDMVDDLRYIPYNQ